MLKLMNLVLLLVILCDGIQSINGESLQCVFKDFDFYWGSMYTCQVTSLDNFFNNMTIDGYTGTHLATKKDKDVKAIWIHGKNTTYIPKGLGSLFDLIALKIHSSQLVEIKAENFLGMQNLEYWDLSFNNLTSLPSDLNLLTKLKVIFLNDNQIKYVASEFFNLLMNLEKVFLNHNICVNKHYIGSSAIIEMKRDIKAKCKNPNESHEIIINLKEENKELIKDKDELKNELSAAKKLQQRNEIEMNNSRDENSKIMKNKDALKMELINKTLEINELNKKFEMNCKHPIDALDVKINIMNSVMEQLLKAFKEHQLEHQEIIKQKASTAKESSEVEEKMEKTIIDLNKEVTELRNQRQLERTTFGELRSKLKEATEQLATCEINERSLV